jgi:hypothetical protein
MVRTWSPKILKKSNSKILNQPPKLQSLNSVSLKCPTKESSDPIPLDSQKQTLADNVAPANQIMGYFIISDPEGAKGATVVQLLTIPPRQLAGRNLLPEQD